MDLSIEQKALKRGNILNLLMAIIGIKELIWIKHKESLCYIDPKDIFSYSRFRCLKKNENCSEVLKSEAIGASIDAILSLGASIAFILFNVIPFLKPLFPISDAIIVIILTIFFAYQPIQLLTQRIFFPTRGFDVFRNFYCYYDWNKLYEWEQSVY